MKVLTEQIVSMPIRNPDTGAPSRTFIFMGKVDVIKVVEELNTGKIVDWKGVADTGRFIQQARIGYQAELYALSVIDSGTDIYEIEYRLIERPGIRYKHPKFTWACKRAGNKNASKVFDNETQANTFANMQGMAVEARCQGNRDRDDYEQECYDWLLTEGSTWTQPDRPNRLVSHTHRITPAKLTQAKWYLHECGKRILDNRRCNRWIPNCKACFAYERPCEYIDLCDALQNGADWQWIIDDRYVVVENSHHELGEIDTRLDVLTYSSLGDLSLCEMIYFWRHEKKVRLQREDDTEPLWVGNALHVGLDTFSKSGQKAAFKAIDQWADDNPVIGEDGFWKQEQQIAKARAMVRAAVAKWNVKGGA